MRARDLECWCGAPPGQPCRNRDGGRAAMMHYTRGLHDRLTMDAIMRSAKLEPLLTDEERRALERERRHRCRPRT